MREVLENDDDFGTRILELMLEFAWCVERVAIDDDVTGPQRTEHANRILQDVRHHQSDARSGRQFELGLQIGGEIARQGIELAVSDLRPHANVGDPLVILRDALLEQRA